MGVSIRPQQDGDDIPDAAEFEAWKRAQGASATPAPQPGGGLSAIIGAAQAGVASWGDEMGGRIAQLFGGDYEKSRDHLRAAEQSAVAEHPKAYLGGAVAGGVGSAMLGGGVSRGLAQGGTQLARALPAARTLGARVGQGAALGAGAGAVAGAGAADGDAGARLRGGAFGAGFGMLAGGAVPAVAAAGRGILDLGLRPKAPVKLAQQFAGQASANPIPTSPGQIAGALGVRSVVERGDDKVLEALSRDGLSVDRLQAEAMRRAARPKPETLMELGGENVNTLAESVAAVPGRGQERLAQALRGRVGERISSNQPQLQRVRSDIESLFGLKRGSTREAAEVIRTRMKETASPLYDTAMSAAPIADERLTRLLNRPSMRAAIGYAQELAGESDIALPDIRAGEPVSVQALHHMKLALDDALYLGRAAARANAGEKATGPSKLKAIADTRRELLTLLDEHVPEYKEARAIWAGESALKDALEEGQSLATRKGFNAEDVRLLVADMSEGEKRMFQQGAMNALLESAGDVSDGRNLAMRVAGNDNLREKLRAIVGSDKALDTFLSDMQRESEIFVRPQRVTGNSATARRIFGVQDLSDAPSPATVQRATGTTLVDALAYLPKKGYELAHRRATEQVAGTVADRLAMGADDPSQMFNLIAALREAEERALAQAGRQRATSQTAGAITGIGGGSTQRPRR